ncbi:MAG: helix-turn-helix domain-containing protein [Candidatus Omnitrophica bacterium]|nr:helix-turn-helix domain-containing protein [Candidatus Omnitrophota bacterium]
MEKLLTVPQVCELLQVSQALVYKWEYYGFVPYIKLGTKLSFKQSKLERWIEDRQAKGRKTYKIKNFSL